MPRSGWSATGVVEAEGVEEDAIPTSEDTGHRQGGTAAVEARRAWPPARRRGRGRWRGDLRAVTGEMRQCGRLRHGRWWGEAMQAGPAARRGGRSLRAVAASTAGERERWEKRNTCGLGNGNDAVERRSLNLLFSTVYLPAVGDKSYFRRLAEKTLDITLSPTAYLSAVGDKMLFSTATQGRRT